jgi:hypothetical protein
MPMNYRHCGALALLLGAAQPVASATREQELPDKEMLRMIDLLRDMEMIKQMDMLREMERLEAGGAQVKNSAPTKAAPSSKKESLK